MTEIKFNISHSAMSNYFSCNRCFLYGYILGLSPEENSVMCYSDAGNVVHSTLEDYNKNLDELKEIFDKLWEKKNLSTTNVDAYGRLLKKDVYWKMIEVGKSRNYKINKKEELFQFKDDCCIKGYIDAITTDEELIDWKTSSNEDGNYGEQLDFYSYLYYRKHNKLPTKVTIDYLKLNRQVSKIPTMQDIKNSEDKIKKFKDEILSKQNFDDWKPNFDACFFCGYKNRCKNVGISKEVEKFVIEISGGKFKFLNKTSPLFDKVINKIFSYEILNKEIVCRQYKIKYGKIWNGIIYLKNRKGEYGLGLLNKMLKHIDEYGVATKKRIEVEIIDKRIPLKKVEEFQEKSNGVELYDYQIEAVKIMLRKKIGIIKVATSGGKTIIASEIFRKNPVKTLFVTDRLLLSDQTQKEFEKVLNLKDKIGQITGGKIEERSNFTIGNIQTIAGALNAYKKAYKKYKQNRGDKKLKEKLVEAAKKTDEMKKYLDDVQQIFIDEVHIAKSSSYDSLFNNLPNIHIISGLSGTPDEKAYNYLELQKNVGDIIVDISAKELIEKEKIMSPTIKFLTYEFGNCLTGNFVDLQEQLFSNINRNNIIINLCKQHQGDVILILVDRIAHGELLMKKLDDEKLENFFIRGEVGREERELILKDAREGHSRILLGTNSIVSKGLNIPALKVIINATGNVSDIRTIQSLGRVLRLCSGKTSANYYDFYDDIDKFKSHSDARISAFKEEGHKVEILKWKCL